MRNVACNCNGITLFISVNTHTRYPSLLIRNSSSRAATNCIISIRYEIDLFASANNNEIAAATGRDMIYQAKLRTYYLHTQHLIYNCNISIYFYGVTSS